MAQAASEPIKVTAFFPELSEVGTEVSGYLREVTSGAPNLKLAQHDRLLVPALAKEAKVTQDGVVVTAYEDDATGTMVETADTGGHFVEVVLRPRVTFESGTDRSKGPVLHERAHHLCFIANSVNFPVRCEPADS